MSFLFALDTIVQQRHDGLFRLRSDWRQLEHGSSFKSAQATRDLYR